MFAVVDVAERTFELILRRPRQTVRRAKGDVRKYARCNAVQLSNSFVCCPKSALYCTIYTFTQRPLSITSSSPHSSSALLSQQSYLALNIHGLCSSALNACNIALFIQHTASILASSSGPSFPSFQRFHELRIARHLNCRQSADSRARQQPWTQR